MFRYGRRSSIILSRKIPAEELTHDMPGDLATDAAPERVVRVIAVGNLQKGIGHANLVQFRNQLSVSAGWN